MHIVGWIWHYGLPVVLLVAGAGMLASTIRADVSSLESPRASWPLIPLLLFWTGDAALGDGRPPFERVMKGLLAIPFLLSFAVILWRRRRHSRKAATNPDQSAR